jgi:vacuolar-type H+-ATPase catalytic subunit A/Vma1
MQRVESSGLFGVSKGGTACSPGPLASNSGPTESASSTSAPAPSPRPSTSPPWTTPTSSSASRARSHSPPRPARRHRRRRRVPRLGTERLHDRDLGLHPRRHHAGQRPPLTSSAVRCRRPMVNVSTRIALLEVDVTPAQRAATAKRGSRSPAAAPRQHRPTAGRAGKPRRSEEVADDHLGLHGHLLHRATSRQPRKFSKAGLVGALARPDDRRRQPARAS